MGDLLKSNVATFRIKELQQCLDLLGLRKAGRKAELSQRLVAFVEQGSPAEVEKKVGIVNKVHAVMHGIPTSEAPSGAAARSSAAAAAQNSHVPAVDQRAAVASRSAQALGRANTTIRCICRQNQDFGRQMIQCEDPECGVWQHCSCVGLAHADLPGQWFCEQCRAALADPFWRRTHLFDQPVRLQRQQPAKYTPSGSAEYVWAGETFVQARASDLDPVRRQQERVMVACVLLTDSVPFRFNWPRSSDLRINNMQYRPYTRNNSTKLGDNARDEPATVGQMISSSGRNRVALACIEEREPFCLMVYRATQRTLEEVKALMAAPEAPQAALERVSRQLGGAKADAKGIDEDEEDDFEMGNTVTSLRDPFTNMRIKVPVRFAGVKGVAAFDLDTFLEMAQRTRKWQCPHSMRNMSVRQLHLDGWMMQVLQALQDKADVAEVEVDPQGRWRPLGSLGRWFTILEDHSSIRTSLAEAGRIKPEPGTEAAGAFGDVDSDEESEDEMEELRRAAAAMKAASTKPKDADIIVLDSSDDETPPPLPPAASPSSTDMGAPPFYLQGNKPSARAAAPAARAAASPPWLTQARQNSRAVGADGRPWPDSIGNAEQLAQPQRQQPSANVLGDSGAGLLQGNSGGAGLQHGISAHKETQLQQPPITLRMGPDSGSWQGSAGNAPAQYQQSSGSAQRADSDVAVRDSSVAPGQSQQPPAAASGLRQLPPSLGGPGPAAPGTTMPGRVAPRQQQPPASGGLTVRLRLPGRGSQPPSQPMSRPASAGVHLPTSPGSPQASHGSLLGKRKAAEEPAETTSPFNSPPHMPIVPNGVSRSQGPVPVMPAGPTASSGLNLPGSATAPGGLDPPGTGTSTAAFSGLLIPGMPRSPAMPNGGTQSYSMYTGLYGSQAPQQQQQAPAMLGVRHPATLPGQVPAQSAGWGSSGLQMPFASLAAGASSVPLSLPFTSVTAAPVQVPLTQVPAASLQLPGAALQPPPASVQLPTGRGSPLQMPTGSSAPTPGAQQGVTYPYNSHHPQQQPVMPMGHLSPAKSPGLKLPGQQPQANGSSAWGSGVSISARMSDAERASAVRELTSKARPHLTNSHGVRLPGATADQAIDLSDSE